MDDIQLKIIKEKNKNNQEDKFNILLGNNIIGNIILLKSNNIINIKYLVINENYRGKGYGEKVIRKICFKYPNYVVTGEIFYIEPINFWAKFDKSLNSFRSYNDKIKYIVNYGLFEFKTNDI